MAIYFSCGISGDWQVQVLMVKGNGGATVLLQAPQGEGAASIQVGGYGADGAAKARALAEKLSAAAAEIEDGLDRAEDAAVSEAVGRD